MEQLTVLFMAKETLRLFGIYVLYLIVFAASLLVMRFTTPVPDYIFRKLLHIVAFTSIFPLLLCTRYWWAAVAAQLLLLVLVFFALLFFERFSFYSDLFVEKGRHEVVTSFVMLFGMLAAFLAVFWGGMGDGGKYIVAASVMAWGPGDAAAAITGKNIGRHKLRGPHIEGTKSVEGTVAMGLTSFLCTVGTLWALSPLTVPQMLAVSLIIAPIAALTELYTKHGLDTVTVPLAASAVLVGQYLFF